MEDAGACTSNAGTERVRGGLDPHCFLPDTSNPNFIFISSVPVGSLTNATFPSNPYPNPIPTPFPAAVLARPLAIDVCAEWTYVGTSTCALVVPTRLP